MRRKIIFLTGYWDSRVDPTVVCIKAIMHHFANNHYDVQISTYWGRKKKQNKKCEGYNICYVRPSLSISLFDAYYHSKKGVFKQIIFYLAKSVNILHRVLTIVNYPIGSTSLVKRWAKSTIGLIDPSEDTVLVSVVNPEDSIYVGNIVKKHCPNIKWITYNLDCGTNVLPGSTFENIRKALHNKSVTAENNALSLADKIIVMRGHYDYYKKHLTQENAIKLLVADIPLLQDKPKVNDSSNSFVINERLNFVYAGTMTGVYYDPKSICDYFLVLKKQLPNVFLDLYGITDKDGYLNELSKSGVGITYHGVILHDKLEKVFSEADVLIYYKNEVIDSVSGKFFEYLSYKKPVIYYGIGGDINYNNVLRYDYGLSLDCKNKIEENVNKTLSFLKDLENKKPVDYNKVKETYKLNLSSYAYSLILS